MLTAKEKKAVIGVTKRKIEVRIKDLERDINLNKSSTATSRLNNKYPTKIYFNNVEKLANYNNLNYLIQREAIEIATINSDVCNDMLHIAIDNT